MDVCESDSAESVSDIEDAVVLPEGRPSSSVVGGYWQAADGQVPPPRPGSSRSASWNDVPRPIPSSRGDKGNYLHRSSLDIENKSSDSSSSKEHSHNALNGHLKKDQVGDQSDATARALETQEKRESDEPAELPAVVPINVGGYRFMTRLSTLCKFPDSMLAAMFSGRHKLDRDKHGYYFIDSNGIYFGYILDFLRHESVPPMDVAVNVYKEACYYNIAPLVEKLQSSPPVAKNVVRDLHRAQFPDYYGLKQRVIKRAVENAVVNQTGEVLLYAFQKVFTPRAPYFNPQHDCVADAAHLCVGPWDSAADEEVLVRCLEQDLQSEGFTIKPHEQRRRCKYYNGQNCQKSVYRITFYFA